MNFYFYVLVFLIGTILGSFFNVIIFRFGTKESATQGRSKCLNCHSIIRWGDLLPILSYFLLKGRCRKCKNKISPIYPIVESSTGIILLLFFIIAGDISYISALNAFIILVFLLIAFFDLIYFIIPDKLLVLLAVGTINLKLLNNYGDIRLSLFSAFGLTAFFVILFLASKGRWIGLGDVKLIFIIGFLFGYPFGYLAVVLAVWIAALFSIILILTGRAGMKTEIPFGLFLSSATIFFIIFYYELQKISKYFYQ